MDERFDPSVETRVTKDDVNALPLRSYEGPIHLVRSMEEVPAAVAAMRSEYVLGFDTESRPSFRKGQNFPPCLLQFAGEREVWLFQLRHLEGLDWIRPVLENPAIRKVGVALHEDIRRLQQEYLFEPQGFVELGTITQQLGIVNTGLRSLAAILLSFRVSKGVQVSNWNRSELSEAQIKYAATDAWVSREIYHCLRSRDACTEEAGLIAGGTNGSNGANGAHSANGALAANR